MRKRGQAGAQGLEKQELREGVREVLVGPHDVGDLHGGVVDDAGEVVKRRAIGTDDDEIADLVGRKLDVALDQVVEDERSARGDLEAQVRTGRPSASNWAASCGGELFAAKSIGAFVALGRVLLGGALAVGAVVAIDVARSEQLVGCPPIAIGPLRLVIRSERPADFRPLVPVDPDPAKTVEDALDGIIDVAFLIGIVDPQDELAAMMPRQQPVEQSCPNPADVQEAGRTGGESGAYTHES